MYEMVGLNLIISTNPYNEDTKMFGSFGESIMHSFAAEEIY